jgi:hypothetical protein
VGRVKIVYLIIASNNYEHKYDEQTQVATWANPNTVHVIWLRGGKTTHFDPEKRSLTVKVAEEYENILEKTILGMQWCLSEIEFDFLIRANVSTYFRTQKVEETLSKIPTESTFIGGYTEFVNQSKEDLISTLFVNGGAIFLNHNAVCEISKMTIEEWAGMPDDFAISQHLINKGSFPVKMSRGNVSNTGILTNSIYYRMKSSRNSEMASIRMQRLHDILSKDTAIRKFTAYLTFQYSELENFKRNFLNLREYLLSLYSIFSSFIRWSKLRCRK